jgi:hypothetical protein
MTGTFTPAYSVSERTWSDQEVTVRAAASGIAPASTSTRDAGMPCLGLGKDEAQRAPVR